MTYNEWRDELKSNLLSVSDTERRRVLDYYAEAYADRREAGFSEREIIDEFGAPYDAAQRILSENTYDAPEIKGAKPEENASAGARRNIYGQPPRGKIQDAHEASPPPPNPAKSGENYGWLFVLLCIIFCVPLFGLIMGLVGITVGLCVAPFALIVSGAVTAGGSIVIMIGGDVAYGLYTLGGGLIALGLGVILLPLFGKLVKFIWKMFKTAMQAIKNVFTGKEQTA